MRVGLISDTHDHIIRIREATALLNRASIDVALHAGDYCAPFAVRELGALDAPLHGITGNNDGDFYQLARAFAEIGAHMESQWWETEIGGRKILVMHEPRGIHEIAAAQTYDLVVFGHTHERDERRIGSTLLVNPGEVCGWVSGTASLAVYDTDRGTVEFHEF